VRDTATDHQRRAGKNLSAAVRFFTSPTKPWSKQHGQTTHQLCAAGKDDAGNARRNGTLRAHVPVCFWFFANAWNDVFRNGVLDHAIKEVCRLHVSRTVVCEF